MKKSLCLLLIALFLLSGCEKTDVNKPVISYGAVKDVEIAGKETGIEFKEIFTEIEDDLAYKYDAASLDIAGIRLAKPENWTASPINGRILRLVAPEDDPYIPGCSICIAMSLKSSGEDLLLPYEFEEYFEADLEHMAFSDGDEIIFEGYTEAPSEYFADSEISEETQLFSFLTYDDVYATNQDGSQHEGDFSSIHANINWNGIPVTARTLVKRELKENALKVLTHIVSSFSSYSHPSPSLKEIQIGGITLMLPTEFSVIPMNGIEFLGPGTRKNSRYAGIEIGFFDIGYEETDDMTFAKAYGTLVAEAMMPKGSYCSIVSLPSEKTDVIISGKTAAFRTVDLTYISKSKADADGFYGGNGDAVMFLYFLPAEKDHAKILALWSTGTQIEEALDLNSLLANHTRLD